MQATNSQPMTTFNISRLSMQQLEAVWQSETFCMLTDDQLAALHKRWQQLIQSQLWDLGQEKKRLTQRIAADKQELKRRRTERQIQFGVDLRRRLVKAAKRAVVLLALSPFLIGVAFGLWVLFTRLVIMGAALAPAVLIVGIFSLAWLTSSKR